MQQCRKKKRKEIHVARFFRQKNIAIRGTLHENFS